MSKRVFAFAAGVCLAAASLVNAQPASSAGPPPIVDRELYFGDPEISGAQLSPDGRFMAFLKPLKGTRNIWVKSSSEPFEKARPITADTKRPIASFFWSRDSRAVLYVQDQGGDENYNVYAVDPAAPPAAGAEVPPARNLTAAKNVRAFIYAVPKSEPDVMYVGLNDREAAWHDLYKVRISTGERQLVRRNTERLTGWVFDTKDELRLATRSAENGETEVLRIDQAAFTKIYSCSVFETCSPLQFHKDGTRVYMVSNKGGAVDLMRLTLVDVATGAETVVESDPEKRVDIDNAIFSDRTDELLATVYVDDRQRIYFKDPAFEADYRRVEKQLPGRELNFRSPTADEQRWIVSAASDIEPGEAYLYDRAARTLTLQYRIYEKLPRTTLAAMTSVRYPSSDGLEIPAYLTLPKGVTPRGLPAIVVPHGGPWARDVWGYDAFAQFLANRGYAVLQPNFRGSTGYGRRFLDAGNKQWGEKMQDDITWGVKYLVAQGIADPARVGVMGGSYGGYATLAGVAFTPEVYAAGVSLVGPSNLITLLDSIPAYWEAGRKVFYERMGDPSTPAGRAQLERQSPLNSAAKITTPLLVIQGANDPRVNKAESDQIVVALRDRGFPVEYIVAPDEGHGFARPVNNMAAFAAAERFLAAHLKGRFQEGATPEVAARLKEITVDPKTVVLQRKADAASITTPTPASDLVAGSWSYAMKIAMAGQAIDLAMTVTVAEEGGAWTVTERATTPMGDAVDTTTLEKGSLLLRKRSITQGQVAISFEVKDGRAVGQMSMGGKSQPIDVALGGPLFADGAGANEVIARLPLADGYTASFLNFDVESQKVTVSRLHVAGAEQVTVPAGTFDCVKVDVASDDGGKATLWVARDLRRVVKLSASSPRMQGATITAELK
ncbi:MAG: prolyl oligopeptidase family serine peptidase [Vicinamibacterales bacterium]